jgi:hypothetical protein
MLVKRACCVAWAVWHWLAVLVRWVHAVDAHSQHHHQQQQQQQQMILDSKQALSQDPDLAAESSVSGQAQTRQLLSYLQQHYQQGHQQWVISCTVHDDHKSAMHFLFWLLLSYFNLDELLRTFEWAAWWCSQGRCMVNENAL